MLVISEETRRLVAGQFALEDLGPRNLKGISRPMEVFRVTGKSDAPSRFQATAAVTGLTPFVGREPGDSTRSSRPGRTARTAAVKPC